MLWPFSSANQSCWSTQSREGPYRSFKNCSMRTRAGGGAPKQSHTLGERTVSVAGPTDLVLLVACTSNSELDTVRRHIATTPGIATVQTHVSLRTHFDRRP